MIVTTTLSQFVSSLPQNKLIGSCGYYRKNTGGHTPAHETVITAQRNAGADYLYASYYEFQPLKKAMAQALGYSDDDTRTDGPFDQQYCLDWCETHGIDLVLVPDRADMLSVWASLDKAAAKAWIEGWFGNTGYSHPDAGRLISLKYQIFTNYVFKEILGVHISFKAQSIVNGYLDFAFLDFLRRAGWVDNVITLPIVYRPDGLPEQSHWSNYSAAQLAVLAQVVPAMDTVGYNNMVDFQAWSQAVKAAVDATGATVKELPGQKKNSPPMTHIYSFSYGAQTLIELYVILPGSTQAILLTKVLA
jgi:hypothetical protein